MSDTYDYDAFLSHSSTDKVVVREIADYLKGAGLRVWLDEKQTRPGDFWGSEIEKAVKRSRAFLLFMSEDALKSEWVQVEFRLAMLRDPDNSHHRLIPILLEDCEISPMLQLFQYIDWREGSPKDYQLLLEACRRACQDEDKEESFVVELETPGKPFDISPDDGFQSKSTPEGPTALALGTPDFHSLPLDLGAAFGLERGSFTGLLAGWSNDGVYQALLRTEAALWRCLKELSKQPLLPVRWWFRIHIGPASAPETPEQVWNAVEDQRSKPLAYLRERGLDKNLLLGFLCELKSLDFEDRSLFFWHESLRQLFVSHSPAVVFDVTNPEASAISAAMHRLNRQSINGSPRIDVLFLFPRLMTEPPPVSVKLLPNQLRSLVPEFGTCIDRQRAAEATEEDKEARQLVESLDARNERASGSYGELLEWTSQNRPTLFLPSLRACARSACAQGRRESLVFATRADVWLDVWLSEADLSQPSKLIDLATPADPEGGVLIDHLALALMRRLDWVGDPHSLEALLATLSPRLSRELHLVDRLRRREIEIDSFLSTSGPREQRLALRAGLSPWPSRKLMETTDLDRVDFWRLLTAMPVNSVRISDLLSLPDPACRAVFGLCTGREWAAIARDKTLTHLVLEARRGRPLDINQER
jgi:hypothetical protein